MHLPVPSPHFTPSHRTPLPNVLRLAPPLLPLHLASSLHIATSRLTSYPHHTLLGCCQYLTTNCLSLTHLSAPSYLFLIYFPFSKTYFSIHPPLPFISSHTSYSIALPFTLSFLFPLSYISIPLSKQSFSFPLPVLFCLIFHYQNKLLHSFSLSLFFLYANSPFPPPATASPPPLLLPFLLLFFLLH